MGQLPARGGIADAARRPIATNRAPVPQNQSLTTALDTALAITLAATDPNGDAMTFIIATPPANGTLSGALPNLVYTPAARYVGFDHFTFAAHDGKVDSVLATVTIDVGAAGNHRPAAANQWVATAEDTARAVTLSGTDSDGDALTYTIVASNTGPSTATGATVSDTFVAALTGVTWTATGTPGTVFTASGSHITPAVDQTCLTRKGWRKLLPPCR